MDSQFPVVLRELRKHEKLTQKEIAEIMGVSQRAYAFYEQGSREPCLGTLAKLSKYFQVPIDFLAGGFLWLVDRDYKDITTHYNIGNMKLLAKSFEQALELARAKITNTDMMNVITGEVVDENDLK